MHFLITQADRAVFVLGFVFLAVTGGEALYADLGHFGRRPIRLGWFTVAFPALVLNYLGQGGLLLHDPTAADYSFSGWPRLAALSAHRARDIGDGGGLASNYLRCVLVDAPSPRTKLCATF